VVRKPKPNDQTEWWVKKQVKKILEDTGWTCWMPNAGVFGRSGVSDFLCVKQPALFMVIETKYKEVVTPLQFEFLTDVYEAGHYAFLVDETNIDELRHQLELNILWPGSYRDGELVLKSLLKWQTQTMAEKVDN
jgi:hypothetical protein